MKADPDNSEIVVKVIRYNKATAWAYIGLVFGVLSSLTLLFADEIHVFNLIFSSSILVFAGYVVTRSAPLRAVTLVTLRPTTLDEAKGPDENGE
jgi:uncharacterized membrane protein